jgi:hypothetical protein
MASMVLFVSLELARCVAPNADCAQAQQATVSAVKATGVPVYVWPESEERPDKTEPPHGEGSGESVMYGGIHSNISNTASVVVDSGVSGGVQPLLPVTWLPNGLKLITSTIELVEPFPPVTMASALENPIHSNTTKHLANPSTIKQQRFYTRRS